MNSKINVIIPMAGRGSRFSEKGFSLPKPLIPVLGKPMIQAVIENLNIRNANYTFIILEDHDTKFQLATFLRSMVEGCNVIKIDSVTEGPACTALLAREHIDDKELIITNCDQVILDFRSEDLTKFADKNECSGILGAFLSSSKKNSYVKIGDNGWITDVKEKIVISDIATNGLHYWKNGQDFVSSAERMISNNERYNNEFYIAPTYNYLIKEGHKILPFFYNFHIPIGIPEDLSKFERDYGNI